MANVDFIGPLHNRTKRDYVGRVVQYDKANCSEIAKKYGQDYWDALATLRRKVEALAEEGIILRDPQAGVVDFPSRREGRKVLLCWKVGEPEVGWWHGEEEGFAGRKPLPFE